MKFSIVTISFNQVKYIERCILSVLKHKKKYDIEYIVVDACSTDGTREILEKYRSQIDCIIIEKDDGPSDGLNKGFSKATGKVFGYINADDAYINDPFAELTELFTKNIDLVFGNSYIVDGNGIPIKRFISNKITPKRFIYGAAVVAQQSTFFSSEIYKKTLGFNIQNRTSWDAELVIDMLIINAKVVYSNSYWSIFSIYPDSITGSQRFSSTSIINRNKIFKKVEGREKSGRDLVIAKFYKLIKLPLNITSTFWSIATKCGFGNLGLKQRYPLENKFDKNREPR